MAPYGSNDAAADGSDPGIAGAGKPEWLTPSSVALIAANLLPVYGVLFLGWDVFPVVLLFWLENVVIGVLNVLRIACVQPQEPAFWVGKVFIIPFFCFHYGMFTAVHGVFVFALFGGNAFEPRGLPTPAFVWSAIRQLHVTLPFLALAASHAFSFAWNYIGKGEYRRTSVQKLFTQPYGRIVVLQLVLIFGGFLVMALGSPLAGMLLLVVLKIVMDARAHLREHRREAEGEPAEHGGTEEPALS
jgi:hypothetical protein